LEVKDTMLNKLLPAVERAGVRMKEFYERRDTQVSFKGEIDLVTQYDLELERMLTESLGSVFPDFRIIGEESSPPDIGKQPGKVIYIDPIDGTTSFVHRFPFAGISVGVYIDNEPRCAVVCSPMLGELYHAIKGEGAYMNGKKINVSKTDKAIRSLFSTGFSYDRGERQKQAAIFARILDISQGMRRTGSAALDLCYVARGTFDFYYEGSLKPWDMAAGILIVQEAGGKVTDLRGCPHNLGSGLILASNGLVHDEYISEITAAEL
jgi:myo-inositol-1(or 4)-monophosphatase